MKEETPVKDNTNTYHSLVVAAKDGVKYLVGQLSLLLKVLGSCQKIFLTPSAWY
jgi:hypothetical protein